MNNENDTIKLVYLSKSHVIAYSLIPIVIWKFPLLTAIQKSHDQPPFKDLIDMLVQKTKTKFYGLIQSLCLFFHVLCASALAFLNCGTSFIIWICFTIMKIVDNVKSIAFNFAESAIILK